MRAREKKAGRESGQARPAPRFSRSPRRDSVPGPSPPGPHDLSPAGPPPSRPPPEPGRAAPGPASLRHNAAASRTHQHRASRRVRPRPPAPSASARPGSAATSPQRGAERRARRHRLPPAAPPRPPCSRHGEGRGGWGCGCPGGRDRPLPPLPSPGVGRGTVRREGGGAAALRGLSPPALLAVLEVAGARQLPPSSPHEPSRYEPSRYEPGSGAAASRAGASAGPGHRIAAGPLRPSAERGRRQQPAEGGRRRAAARHPSAARALPCPRDHRPLPPWRPPVTLVLEELSDVFWGDTIRRDEVFLRP